MDEHTAAGESDETSDGRRDGTATGRGTGGEETGPLAVHLAAGEGTRLRPLTSDRPKPLVELGGESMLERNVDTLAAAGVPEQLVVTGYRADQIRALGYETVHNAVYDETDMVYSLFCAREAFGGRDLLISYGDIVYEPRLVEALVSCDAPLCVVVDEDWQSLWEARFEEPLADAETLDIDQNGFIREIGAEPSSSDEIDAQYVGLLKVRADHLTRFADIYDELAGQEDGDAYTGVEMTAFVQRLVDEGWDVQAVPVEGGWVEVDTTGDLELYHEWLETGTMAERRNLDL